jgi:hypothetical protein
MVQETSFSQEITRRRLGSLTGSKNKLRLVLKVLTREFQMKKYMI